MNAPVTPLRTTRCEAFTGRGHRGAFRARLDTTFVCRGSTWGNKSARTGRRGSGPRRSEPVRFDHSARAAGCAADIYPVSGRRSMLHALARLRAALAVRRLDLLCVAVPAALGEVHARHAEGRSAGRHRCCRHDPWRGGADVLDGRGGRDRLNGGTRADRIHADGRDRVERRPGADRRLTAERRDSLRSLRSRRDRLTVSEAPAADGAPSRSGARSRAVAVRTRTLRLRARIDSSSPAPRPTGGPTTGDDPGTARTARPPLAAAAAAADPLADADADSHADARRRRPRRSPDTQAPSVPQGMAWTTTRRRASACAGTRRSDNVGVTGYRIYRNGTLRRRRPTAHDLHRDAACSAARATRSR